MEEGRSSVSPARDVPAHTRPGTDGGPPDERSRLAFLIRLPFLLPISEETVHRLPVVPDPGGRPFLVDISLRHLVANVPEVQDSTVGTGFDAIAECAGWPPADWPALATKDKVIEQTWVRLEAEIEGGDVERDLGACFTLCLSELNRLVRAVNLVADARLPLVRREQLDPVVPVERFDPQTQEWSKNRLLVLRVPRLASSGRFTANQEDQLNAAINLQGAPGIMRSVVRHRDWLERAKYATSQQGDYEGAVVALQTSVEIFMRAVHELVLVDLNYTASQIQSETSEDATSFNRLYKTVLPKLLGGDWSSKSSAAVVYTKDLYRVRNQIAHAGRALTRRDAEAASAAYEGIVDLIIARLIQQTRRYPRTALALLGRPGLERHGRWTGYFEQFVAGLVDEPDAFWLPYDIREALQLSLMLFRTSAGAWDWYVIDRAWRLAAAISEPEGLGVDDREFLASRIAQVDADQPEGTASIEVTEAQTTPPRGPVWFPVAELAVGREEPEFPRGSARHPRLDE